MITELLFITAVNYIQATNPAVTEEDAYTLVEGLNEYSKTTDDFLYFLAMAEVESKFDIHAKNKVTKAYGALQVMPMHFKSKKEMTPTWALKKGIQQYYLWSKGCNVKWARKDIYCAARFYNGGYRGHRSTQTLTYAKKIDTIYNMHKQGLLGELL